jgi:hypothetical protein
MATLVLGTIGRVFGGPVGGIIGTAVGGFVDRAVLGGGGGGSGRLANLTVQSAAYGEAIPVVSGRMRVAGNLIWTAGIVESSGAGGKRNGGSSSSAYVYTASFAVGLGAGPIADIGRIWADGRQIRAADGAFLTPTVMRLHNGDEGQQVDPLIAAAEGVDGTPAYRGIAYVVFEDLALVDFGNRIPNLTFELIADEGEIDMGSAIRALTRVDGRDAASVSGTYPPIVGHFAGSDGSIADNIAGLIALSGGSVLAGPVPSIIAGLQAACLIEPGDRAARSAGAGADTDRQRRLGGETRIDSVEIGYFDIDRDYQLGLQRAHRAVAGIVERRTVGAAMAAGQAKSLAESMLGRAQAARVQTVARLPWRYLGIQPGAFVRTVGDETLWRVRQVRFEDFVVNLELERAEHSAPVPIAGASGRALRFADSAPGPTTLVVLDLPQLPGEELSSPRLLVAAAGAGPGWRRTAIEMSVDGGISYVPVGGIERGSVIGTAIGVLPIGTAAAWDHFSSVDVMLLSDGMWLESRQEASILAGANLALIGDELVQFSSAEAIAPQVFRLSGFLRGRRGTESRIAGHVAGERFVLLDRTAMLACPLPVEALGAEVLIRSAGVDDGGVSPVLAKLAGATLEPLSPADLQLETQANDVIATWIRRSRDGFGWADFVDAPLAEWSERYQVDVVHSGRLARQIEVVEPRFIYSAAMQAEDGGNGDIAMAVRQMSAAVGPGQPARAEIRIVQQGDIA